MEGRSLMDSVQQSRGRIQRSSRMTDSNPDEWQRPFVWAFWGATALLVLVIVGVGIRASSEGWLAMADDAFLAMRSRGVFGGHTPLLSTASSAGSATAESFNHPGALMLWMTAPVVSILGSGGMPFAVSLVSGASVALTSWLLWRNARPVLAATVLTALAALCWSMGSGLLTDVWNPHANMLPFLLAVVATWAVLQKDCVAIPVGLVALSVVAQTHLSFAAMCIPLVAIVLAVPVFQILRARRVGDGELARRWSIWLLVGIVLSVLSALPPLVEQIAGGSEGNMLRILRGAGDQDPGVGIRSALALFMDKLVVPPTFLRGSWNAPIYLSETLVGWALPIVTVTFVAAVALAIATARRRGDRQVGSLVVLTALLLVAGVLIASRLPPFFGFIRLSAARWLWPLSALIAAGLLARPVEMLGELWKERGKLIVTTGLCALVGIMAIATVPHYHEDMSGSLPREQQILADIWGQAGDRLSELEAVEIEGGGVGGQLYVIPGLINTLDEAGVEVGLNHEVQIQQAGDWTLASGEEPWVLTVQTPGEPVPEGSELIASYRPVDEARAEVLQNELSKVIANVSEQDLVPSDTLDENGISKFIDPLLETWREDPRAALGSLQVAALLEQGILQVRGQDQDALAELVSELGRIPLYEMDLYLAPRS